MKHFGVLLARSCGPIIALAVATSSWSAPIDEAKAEGKTPADFPKITEDVFKPMDQGRDYWGIDRRGNSRAEYLEPVDRGQSAFLGQRST